jgi:hypothetical protein
VDPDMLQRLLLERAEIVAPGGVIGHVGAPCRWVAYGEDERVYQ